MSGDDLPDLDDQERATYEWQMWVEGFGEAGQRRLKNASVLVSRVGGVGGAAAYHLAAAGIGRLVLAHGGNIQPSDLNRQLLMTHAGIGTSRIASAERRLRELNPRVEIVTVDDQVNESNAATLVGQCDVVVACAPRFGERLAMNRAAVVQGKPLVNCAMYELQAELSCVLETRVPGLRRRRRDDRRHGRDGGDQAHRGHRRAAGRAPVDGRPALHDDPDADDRA
jgi:molybdopterin/thiamine biosynthesis adenylyltransferase